MVVCIVVRAKMFSDAIDDIRNSTDVKQLSKDCRDWFESYPNHDGVLDSLLLGRFLGFEHGITLGQKVYFANDSNPDNVKCHSWLIFPELCMEFDMLYMKIMGNGNGDLMLSSLGQHPMGTDMAPLLKENFMNHQMKIVANTTLIDPDLQEPQFKNLFTSLYSIICNKVPRNCPDVEIIKEEFVQTIFPVKPPKI